MRESTIKAAQATVVEKQARLRETEQHENSMVIPETKKIICSFNGRCLTSNVCPCATAAYGFIPARKV